MRWNFARCAIVVATGMAGNTMPAIAQVKGSELGTISQVIDGTTITMQYSRPRVRGRNPLFGTKAVHWGEVWTPGANYATTLETDKAIALDGRAVPKGKYSVWFVVRQSGDWTMVLDPKWRQFHNMPPDSNPAQIRFGVQAHEAPFAEVLTWSMPDLRVDGGTLAMNWERITVSVNVGVTPSLTTTMPLADAQQYVGRYDFMEVDSTGKVTKTSPLVLDYENGTLKGRVGLWDGYLGHFAMVRVAPDWFVPAVYDKKGVIYEVLRPDVTIEFAREKGRPMTFEWRGDDDKVFAKGRRRP
ncbi:MAG: hypothetical protein JWL61_5455 [Gemmatimonadetes bacterium]|nr:hypothetical protein [Gemmatimonadota bacterium]